MKCANCGSSNIQPYITIPERKQGMKLGRCRRCQTEVIQEEKTIFD